MTTRYNGEVLRLDNWRDKRTWHRSFRGTGWEYGQSADGAWVLMRTKPGSNRCELHPRFIPRPEAGHPQGHRKYRYYMTWGVDYAIRYRFRFSGAVDPVWHILLQCWQADEGNKKASPPFSLMASNPGGSPILQARHHAAPLDLGVLVQNIVYDVILHFRWSDGRATGDGFMDVYLDRRKLHAVPGPNCYSNPWAPYLKIGLYHRRRNNPTSTIAVDRRRFGMWAGPHCLEAALAPDR